MTVFPEFATPADIASTRQSAGAGRRTAILGLRARGAIVIIVHRPSAIAGPAQRCCTIKAAESFSIAARNP